MQQQGTEARGRFANVAAAVLLGGRSLRMHRDKASSSIGGVRNDVRMTRIVSGLCHEVLLVGGDPPDELPGLRVEDPDGPACSLRGLVAGLAAAQAPRLLVVATDLPLLTLDLLLALVAWPEADVVVPQTLDGIHPLCAIYRKETVLPVALGRLERGALKLRDVLDAVDCSYFGPSELAVVDPSGTALTNVNTPEEAERVETILSGF